MAYKQLMNKIYNQGTILYAIYGDDDDIWTSNMYIAEKDKQSPYVYKSTSDERENTRRPSLDSIIPNISEPVTNITAIENDDTVYSVQTEEVAHNFNRLYIDYMAARYPVDEGYSHYLHDAGHAGIFLVKQGSEPVAIVMGLRK